MGFERNEKGGTSTVCMSHHLLLTPPPLAPHATHTPTSQTAYFVLQVRDLLSNVFLAWKIYLSIKLNADASKQVAVSYMARQTAGVTQKGSMLFKPLNNQFVIGTKKKINMISACIQ